MVPDGGTPHSSQNGALPPHEGEVGMQGNDELAELGETSIYLTDDLEVSYLVAYTLNDGQVLSASTDSPGFSILNMTNGNGKEGTMKDVRVMPNWTECCLTAGIQYPEKRKM